jgi:hypothetical protein
MSRVLPSESLAFSALSAAVNSLGRPGVGQAGRVLDAGRVQQLLVAVDPQPGVVHAQAVVLAADLALRLAGVGGVGHRLGGDVVVDGGELLVVDEVRHGRAVELHHVRQLGGAGGGDGLGVVVAGDQLQLDLDAALRGVEGLHRGLHGGVLALLALVGPDADGALAAATLHGGIGAAPPPQAPSAARGRVRARPVQAVRRYFPLVERMVMPPCCGGGSGCGRGFEAWRGGLRGVTAVRADGRGGGLAQDEADGHPDIPRRCSASVRRAGAAAAGRPRRPAGDRLGDGRQADHVGEFVVVEADDGHVVRNPEPVAAQRAQRAHRHLVGLREHGGRRPGGGQQFGHRPLAALDGVVAVRLQGRVVLDPGVGPGRPGRPGGARWAWSSAAARWPR